MCATSDTSAIAPRPPAGARAKPRISNAGSPRSPIATTSGDLRTSSEFGPGGPPIRGTGDRSGRSVMQDSLLAAVGWLGLRRLVLCDRSTRQYAKGKRTQPEKKQSLNHRQNSSVKNHSTRTNPVWLLCHHDMDQISGVARPESGTRGILAGASGNQSESGKF